MTRHDFEFAKFLVPKAVGLSFHGFDFVVCALQGASGYWEIVICQNSGTVKRDRFCHQAASWPLPRRVVAKVERLGKGLNHRFVVTNLDLEPRIVYDWIYTQRGEAENRIKELKNQLKADRLSCHRFKANQFRLLLHTAAYCLFLLLRRHLENTELEAAQGGTPSGSNSSK